MSIKNTLDKYSKSNMYPFHMPGHKRQLPGEYQIDMTEVDGVDDLHDPESVIAEDQKRMAKLYGAEESYFLVGGSTVGNLSAIYASCEEEDLILIQRNSHKSVYNGVTLRHLRVGYIYPTLNCDGIFEAVTLNQIIDAVENNDKPKAIVITSPTYEGYHCKIKEIADYCHDNKIILIVDQAHGAHLGFHNDFKESAVGHADIVIQSLHKTLPALTQTAAMHLSGEDVNKTRLREALDIFETSSPSYVLMYSISQCIDMLEDSGDYFEKYVENLNGFYKKCGELSHIKIINESSNIKDPGKIIISTSKTNITGVELAKILREKYQIETELSSFSYVIAMTSIFDTREGFKRLAKALQEIDEQIESGQINVPDIAIAPVKAMEMYQAKAKSEKKVKLSNSQGMVSASMVCLYPPGAPVIVPGEEITSEALELVQKALDYKIHVTGINNGFISVVN
ncbi:MAG: aminotransferase class I/II-fold pyridoxal phosphate-dependent enzyme [Pseudobutyrivibrio sp.]|nr:aminotransferase class I/II-fold pyridoxal phosphate-dependent enzyme [Pseudobutyrivibrio sp.]